MTTHELAKKLLELPNIMVTINGYEDGNSEVTIINEPKELHLNVHEEWYYGKHDYICQYVEECNHVKIQAINLR